MRMSTPSRNPMHSPRGSVIFFSDFRFSISSTSDELPSRGVSSVGARGISLSAGWCPVVIPMEVITILMKTTLCSLQPIDQFCGDQLVSVPDGAIGNIGDPLSLAMAAELGAAAAQRICHRAVIAISLHARSGNASSLYLARDQCHMICVTLGSPGVLEASPGPPGRDLESTGREAYPNAWDIRQTCLWSSAMKLGMRTHSSAVPLTAVRNTARQSPTRHPDSCPSLLWQ